MKQLLHCTLSSLVMMTVTCIVRVRTPPPTHTSANLRPYLNGDTHVHDEAGGQAAHQ